MVSEGSELEAIPSFISTPTKIRSRYRRRLLNRLSEGGATVTTLARDIGLQIPHASAELRKLRNEAKRGQGRLREQKMSQHEAPRTLKKGTREIDRASG